MLLAENNIPLAFADKLSAILPSIFLDSKIAKEYKMGKTKASCILNESLAPHFLQQTVAIMKTDFCSLSTDNSNGSGLEKMNPVTVHLFDINTNMVGTRFLDMRCTKSQTSGTAVLTKLQLSFHLITQVQT